MSLENKLRKPTQDQMPAAVVDELAVQPPQEPENVADDIFISFELFHSSSDSEEEISPIALRILGIFW
jgi:hypothetical protein